MKIKDLETKTIAIPLKDKLLHGVGEHPGRLIFTIVKIETDEGIIGYGETGGGGYSLSPMIEKLKTSLIGEDLNIRRLRWKVASPISATYYNQLLPQIWFPIETALLDIKGKALGISISDLIGGKVRDEIEVSAYIFPTPNTLTVQELVNKVEKIVKEGGFRVVKLKTGVFSPRHEIDVVKELAERLPYIKFRLDPNGAWSLSEALYVARSLEGVNIEYFEDPVWTTNGLKAFRELSKYPVATNTVAIKFEDLPNVFLRDAVDIVLGDPHWWYGIYGFLELSASLWSLGLELGMHSPTETGIALAAMLHAASASPNLAYAIDTHYIHLSDDIIKSPFNISEGKIKVPTEPGLGVDVDENKIDKYQQLYEEEGEYTYHQVELTKEIIMIPRRSFINCKCHPY